VARKKYDLAVKVGEYQKDGQTKGRYQNIGAVVEGDNGFYMIMDRHFNPAGLPNPDNRNNIIVSMFEPRDRDGGGPAPSSGGNSGGGGFSDDIPF
jgi:hypothetical protein